MAERIGFIGLGKMGSRMARTFAADPTRRLHIFDVDPARTDELLAENVVAAASPQDVATHADTIFLSLPDAQIVADVLFGVDGVADGPRAQTVVELSTVGEDAVMTHAERLAQSGKTLVDAPVSGGPRGAERGTLAIMVSGPSSAVEQVRPCLDILGRSVQVVSETAGKAQVVKLINNMLSDVAMAISAEAMTFAEKAGLDAARVLEVINEGSGRNSATQDKYASQILSGDYDWGFSAGLAEKDMRLYVQHAQKYDSTALLAGAVHEVWRMHVNQHGPESDFTSVEKFYRDLNFQTGSR